jgi:AcrR family transcriptional regulator
VSPTQAERRAATTAALVAAARELFAADGYAATSLDAVAAKAGVTKGAVYHHFAGKRELFEAVLERELVALTESLAGVYARRRDPWKGLEAGCLAFLDACLEPGLQRIMLLDAFAALGWERIRELEAGLLGAMELAIQQAIDAGRIESRPAAPLANFLYGALCELAMVVARADDQRAAERAAVAEVRRVMAGLAAGRGTSS